MKAVSVADVLLALLLGAGLFIEPAAGGNVAATGGDDTFYIHERGTNWQVHVFRTPGSHQFSVSSGGNIDLLLVGGGGGGGGKAMGGGGGAGGFVLSNAYPVAGGGNYTVVVGSGGAGGAYGSIQGGVGGDTSFATLHAYGGGGGGSWSTAAAGSRFAGRVGRRRLGLHQDPRHCVASRPGA